MSPHSGAMMCEDGKRTGLSGRAGKGEVLRYIEPDDEFCLPQDRPKKIERAENATENNEEL